MRRVEEVLQPWVEGSAHPRFAPFGAVSDAAWVRFTR